MLMVFSFGSALLVSWLALQANDPFSAFLGYAYALWVFVSGLIATYVLPNRRDNE